MGMIGKIIMCIGIVILLVSVGTAIAGIIMITVLDSDEGTLDKVDMGEDNDYNFCNFYLFDGSIFIGMGMILASIPVSVLGLSLIIIGRFPEKKPEQDFVCAE